MSESVITIRGSKPKTQTQTKKESLSEKIRNYNKRHSLNNTSSKKDGKPVALNTIKALPKAYIDRFKPKKKNTKIEWEVIFGHYSPSYPYKTQKLRFDAEDFTSAGREVIKIQRLLTKAGGYKKGEIVILGISMAGALEAHLNIKPKPIKEAV